MALSSCSLLLVGGGHAHVAVLADRIKRGTQGQPIILLTPNKTLRYSGMVPGWISGQYDRDEGLVDLDALARRAGAKLVLDRFASVDPEHRLVTTVSGAEIGFQVVSFDTGSKPRARQILGDDPRILDIRPIDRFVEGLESRLAADGAGTRRIAVIGGGAGGVELALALRNARWLDPKPEVVLATGKGGLLRGFSDTVRNRVLAELQRQSVDLVAKDTRIDEGQLLVADASLEPRDLIVAAFGSGAPSWRNDAGAEGCEAEFWAVDQFQRSIFHPHIFAVGDAAIRQDRPVAHSGVHAVMAGPLLAKNLALALEGKPPAHVYKPRRNSLYLLSTGNGSAILSYGGVAVQGRWVAKLKSWIDKRWIATYAKLSKGA